MKIGEKEKYFDECTKLQPTNAHEANKKRKKRQEELGRRRVESEKISKLK